MMRTYFYIILCAIIFNACQAQLAEGVERITLPTFKAELIDAGIQLVDVRTFDEYQRGHIENALNIDIKKRKSFKEEIEKLDKTKPIYFYCQSGYRSNVASKVAKKIGFKTIYDFSGGYKVWSQQSSSKNE